MNLEERAARRGIMRLARVLIGVVLMILLAGAVKWAWQAWR